MNTRSLFILLLAVAMPGCANFSQPVDLAPREGKIVSHGVISATSMVPRRTLMIVDIDRRIYQGTIESTDANETFGLVLAFGQKGGAAESAGMPGYYYRATLSSSDNHLLRCDFTGDAGRQRNGICVDDFRRVYDVLSSQ